MSSLLYAFVKYYSFLKQIHAIRVLLCNCMRNAHNIIFYAYDSVKITLSTNLIDLLTIDASH